MPSLTTTLKHVPARRWKQLLVIAVLAAASLSAGYFQPNLHEAWRLATTQQEETYTELSFVGASSLPETIPTGSTGTFGFRITNHEGDTVSYRYRVVRRSENQVAPGTVISENTVVIPAGDTRTIQASFTLPPGTARNAVGVVLVDRDELITFWSSNR